MPAAAELSSMTASLEELTRRLTQLADQSRDAGDEDTATDLYTVERALQGALRKLHRMQGARR